MPEIEAKNIVKYFKHDKHTLKAINDISLVANSGEFVCIVGPSGCGKSTFLLYSVQILSSMLPRSYCHNLNFWVVY